MRLYIYILRNPHGRSEGKQREVRLAAADEIERWKTAFENLRDEAIEQGISILTYTGSRS